MVEATSPKPRADLVRYGETLDGKMLHDPPETRYTTYCGCISGEARALVAQTN